MPIDFRIGDVIRLRKPHPCGGTDWTVVRLGADIGLRCLKCNHRILITRREAELGTKSFISRAEAKDPFAAIDVTESPTSRSGPDAGAAAPADDV
jgi:hypothetical protein